jgi:large subunit ribosomal protein L23
MDRTKALDVIENPHMTEQAMDAVDRDNKLVLMVDLEADKSQVGDAVEPSITPQAQKKAFISLSERDDAMDVATQLGMM